MSLQTQSRVYPRLNTDAPIYDVITQTRDT